MFFLLSADEAAKAAEHAVRMNMRCTTQAILVTLVNTIL